MRVVAAGERRAPATPTSGTPRRRVWSRDQSRVDLCQLTVSNYIKQ